MMPARGLLLPAVVATACALGGCGSESGGSGGSGAATTGGGDGGSDGGGAATIAATTVTATTVTSSSTGLAACTDAAQCDDLDPCTADVCGADGQCLSTPGDFDDDDRCTIDACDPALGETHVAYVASDDDACTLDRCDPALGTSFVGDLVLLTESFADAEGGWITEAPWAIGPAEPTAPNVRGMADPETDATPDTDDDGIAGVVLGGSPPSALEGSFYLESPEVDADLEGSITLEYRRWLGEELTNAPTVEVWDGEAWIVIWETPRDIADAPPRGDGWVRMQHDLTALRSPTLKVRFGVALGPGGANPSWNVDDVVIARRGWAVDADACTADSCFKTSGPRQTAIDVDDDDACTTDICHPQAGVAHIPVLCDEGEDGCCPPGCASDPDCP